MNELTKSSCTATGPQQDISNSFMTNAQLESLYLEEIEKLAEADSDQPYFIRDEDIDYDACSIN